MLDKLKKILENKKLRSDLILVGVLLVISLSALLFYFVNRTEGSTVLVSVDGKRVAEYPLSVNCTYYINNGTNVLVIEDGYAYISEANCPGYQDCVEEGKKCFVGEQIVCLPNKVTIEIVGEGEGFDI